MSANTSWDFFRQGSSRSTLSTKKPSKGTFHEKRIERQFYLLGLAVMALYHKRERLYYLDFCQFFVREFLHIIFYSLSCGGSLDMDEKSSKVLFFYLFLVNREVETCSLTDKPQAFFPDFYCSLKVAD